MGGKEVVWGITLGQRALGFGAVTMEGLLNLAEWTDKSENFGALFCGDSFLVKHRLDSIALLSAAAARTKRVKLGPACMASFPLRHPIWLAYQWASLDVISNGRSIMVGCIGGGSKSAGGDFENEYRAMGLDLKTRAKRLEEGVEILRRLWTEDKVTYKGEFYEFENVTIGPKPIQKHLPIWLVSNVNLFTKNPELQDRPLRRTARIADGWQTAATAPAQVKENWDKILKYAVEYGRNPKDLECCLQLTVNINNDAEAAFRESKKFLDAYYETDWPREVLENWGAWGSVEQCADKLMQWVDAGADYITLRLVTWDMKGQYDKVNNELMPILRKRVAERLKK